MTYLKHKDIYTKFMIEYDKANVTSSYPSLTEYEVATFLDKAYNALIAQKVTGNNLRRAPLEADIKAISDLQPLIVTSNITLYTANNVASNVVKALLPTDFMYCVSGNVVKNNFNSLDPGRITKTKIFSTEAVITNRSVIGDTETKNGFVLSVDELQELVNNLNVDSNTSYELNITGTQTTLNVAYARNLALMNATLADGQLNPMDTITFPNTSVVQKLTTILNHAKTLYTNCIYVVIKQAGTEMQAIGGGTETVYVDYDGKYMNLYEIVTETGDYSSPMDGSQIRITPIRLNNHQVASKFFSSTFNMPWVKIPIAYIEDGNMYIVEDSMKSVMDGKLNLTYIKKPNTFVKDLTTPPAGYVSYFEGTADAYNFECNDTVAEELVSLAITFALENVESQRLNSKLNTRGLEA